MFSSGQMCSNEQTYTGERMFSSEQMCSREGVVGNRRALLYIYIKRPP